MTVQILQAHQITDQMELEFFQLFKQLSPHRKQNPVRSLFKSDNQKIIACCMEDGCVIGFALMGIYSVISGNKGWIEDVIVDQSHRKRGIGEKLVRLLLDTSKQFELTDISLFTEEHRSAAIHLYEKLDFKVRDSIIFTKRVNAPQMQNQK